MVLKGVAAYLFDVHLTIPSFNTGLRMFLIMENQSI